MWKVNDMKNKWLIIAVVLLANTGIALADSAQVYLSPANATMAPGESINISIIVNPAGNPISGMQANVFFDPAKIRINYFTSGNLFSAGGLYRTFPNQGALNNSSGRLINTFEVIIGRNNVVSIGTYGVINITAVGLGTSSILLDNVKIASPEATPVSFVATNGSITVQAPPTPTPTPTPTPSNSCSKLDFVAPFGTIDAADRTNLYGAIRIYSKDLKYDLNNDGKVTTADLSAFDTLKLTCTW